MTTIEMPTLSVNAVAATAFPVYVKALLEVTCADWWNCPSSLPDLGRRHTPAQQRANEQAARRFTDDLEKELRRLPVNDPDARSRFLESLTTLAQDMAVSQFGYPAVWFERIQRWGFADCLSEFARQARRFDPHISADDIYQAGRNVMTMNFMQTLFGQPARLTPSAFAYSMLYPYTDNYLDDPTIPSSTKAVFNRRFAERIQGRMSAPNNRHEEIIFRLFSMIESEWDRAAYPQVYASLLAIHEGQARSMALNQPHASPFEMDVVGISFEKGGTSVLADGYLVAGDLTTSQAEFMFAYGSFTQLMDDLEDLSSDLAAGSQTVFSVTAGKWKLDGLTSRLLQFGDVVTARMAAFPGENAAHLMELVQTSLHPALIASVLNARRWYSPAFLKTIERHMPLSFNGLEKQNRRMQKRRLTLQGLLDMVALPPTSP